MQIADLESILNELALATGLERSAVAKTTAGANLKANLSDLVFAIKSMQALFKSELKKRDDEIASLKVLIESQINEKTNVEIGNGELWSSVAKRSSKKPSQAQADMLAMLDQENKEKKQREKNIVIFGLAESSKKEAEEKKKDDEEAVKELLGKLKIDMQQVNKIHRTKSRQVERPGTVILEFKEFKLKIEALKAAKQLKNSEQYNKVFLASDMTPAERLTYKKLLKERDELNKELRDGNGKFKDKHYYGIRDNQLVKLNVRR